MPVTIANDAETGYWVVAPIYMLYTAEILHRNYMVPGRLF